MPSVLDYTGASGRLQPAKASSLPSSRWAYMQKSDGLYVRVSTDSQGRIANLVQRNGSPLETRERADFIGMHVGAPDSVLHGELEASTQAGVRAARTRGYPLIHLFDVTRTRGQDVSGAPFAERYARLHQWQTAVELEQPRVARDKRFQRDASGRYHNEAGHYAARIPRDLTRLPVLPLYRGRDAFDRLWSDVKRYGWEGGVACRLDAPAGKGKSKVKPHDTIDAMVVRYDARTVEMLWQGYHFYMGWRPGMEPGTWFEIACSGFYENSVTPKFPRIVRPRPDLTAPAAR